MLGFWEALESAAVTPLQSSDSGQPVRDSRALAEARAFHEEMLQDRDRLSHLDVEVTRLDSTVSFRRNGYGVVSVHFGAGDAGTNRIVSAVAVHLQRDPSYEDVSSQAGVGAAAGRWLGLSIDLIARNPEVFERFGLT